MVKNGCDHNFISIDKPMLDGCTRYRTRAGAKWKR